MERGNCSRFNWRRDPPLPFVQEWPVVFPVSEHHPDSSLSGRLVDLWSYRVFHAGNCDLCNEPIPLGALAFGNRYVRDECGFDVCATCFLKDADFVLLEGEKSLEGFPLVQRQDVHVVAHSPEAAFPDGFTSSDATLFQPHSDCGWSHPRFSVEHLPISITYCVCRHKLDGSDEVQPTILTGVRFHNWYHGSYPKTVKIEVSASENVEDDSLFAVVGQAELTKSSCWHDVGIDVGTLLEHVGGAGVRYVRVTFVETLEDTDYGGKPMARMTLPCVGFLSRKPRDGLY